MSPARPTISNRPFAPAALALVGAAVASAPVAAQGPASYVPREYQGVGMVDRRGESVPLDLAFVDEHGNDVTLDRYFEAGRPVLLTLNYFQCPQLCTLTLNGMVNGLWSCAGRDGVFACSATAWPMP